MKRIYLVVLLLALIKISSAQLTINFGSGVANTSSPAVDIDVLVEDWNEIVSTQFSINWDPSVFSFNSILNVTTVVPQFTESGNIGTPPNAEVVNDGQLTVSWSLISTEPVTVPDGTRLFTIRLNAAGNNCDQTALTVTNVPRVIEIIDANLNDIGVTVGGGALSIDDGTCSIMDGVGLIIEDVNAPSGTSICIPITTRNFNNIASLQTGMTWNASILSYTGINEVGLTGVSTNEAEIANGELKLLWIIGFGEDPVTLGDGATLFELCFDVVGTTGQSTNLNFVDLENFAIEVANGDGAEEDVFTDNGRFQVGSGGGGPMVGVGLIGADIATNGAMSICVPVTTKNFQNIASIQTGVSWDASILSFTGINDGALDGITVNDAEKDNGLLRLLWIIGLGDDPVTVPDDGVLFELCFDVIGSNGQASPVGFVSLPNFAIEIANGDGVAEDFFITDGKVTIGSDGGGNMDGVGLIAGDIGTGDAQSICLPVTTRNFNNIASIQTGIEWDPSIISFTEIREGALQGVTVNDAEAGNGELRLLWIIGLGDDPLNLPDDAVLFEICFDVAAESGTSPVAFTDLPNFAIEVANGEGMAEDFFIDDGSITIGDIPVQGDCPDGLGNNFAIFGQTRTVVQGEEICMDVQVGNFSNIQSMQFTIQWDESILQYVRQDDFGLPDLGNANFNLIADNKLRVSWTPVIPATRGDCHTIFSICFNGIGGCTEMPTSVVEFVDDGNVLIEITDGSNNVLDVDVFPGSIQIEECQNDPQINIQNVMNANCAGQENGAALVDVTGTGDITCQWTDINGEVVRNDCNLVGVASGTYSLTATNGEGNTSTMIVIIDEPDTLNVEVAVTDKDCETVGALEVTVTGGTSANGEYSYEFAAPVMLPDQPNHTDVPEGEYSVRVIDDNGCDVFESFAVEDFSIIIDSEVANVSTIEGNDGGILLVASGGNGGELTYEWSDGATTPDRLDLEPGEYTLTVTDTTGCSKVQTFEVDWEAVFVDLISDESMNRFNGFGISCPRDDNGMIGGTLVGGCNDGPVVFSVNGEETELPISVVAGTYTIRAEDACGNVDEETIEISPPDPITATVNPDINIECSDFGSTIGSVTIELEGGAGDYVLMPTEGVVDGLTINELSVGFVSVAVEDANGCQALFEDIAEVNECPSGECEGATIISPNQDMVNDVFVIGCTQRGRSQPNTLVIFDRWGQLVWEQDDYDNTWAGTDLNGLELDEGGYMWVLKVSDPDIPTEIFRGTVTLLRSS